MAKQFEDNRDDRYKLFLRLYRQNENGIYSFTLKLLPNYSIAEEIMQESLMTMWDKFDSFQQGTNFSAWAKQIVKYKVIQYLSNKNNKSIIYLTAEMIEQLGQDERTSSSYDTYFEALHNCVDKLQGRNKEIIRLRYYKNFKVKDMASMLNTTSNAVSKHIARIHGALKKCINQTINACRL